MKKLPKLTTYHLPLTTINIMADIQYYGTGRRKNAVARVYLRPGSGEIKINKRGFDNYFPNEALRMIIRQPLNLTDSSGKFDILVNVAGGGISGQAGADIV